MARKICRYLPFCQKIPLIKEGKRKVEIIKEYYKEVEEEDKRRSSVYDTSGNIFMASWAEEYGFFW